MSTTPAETRTLTELQDAYRAATTRTEQDDLLSIMAEHIQHPRNKVPVVRTIEEIIEAKKRGEDCTEEESGRMKQLVNAIEFYFPEEFGEAQEQYLDYAGRQFSEMGPPQGNISKE